MTPCSMPGIRPWRVPQWPGLLWLIYLFVLQLDTRFSRRRIALILPPFVLIMSVLALPIVR